MQYSSVQYSTAGSTQYDEGALKRLPQVASNKSGKESEDGQEKIGKAEEDGYLNNRREE